MPDATDMQSHAEADALAAADENAARQRSRRRRMILAVAIGIAGTIFGGLEIHDRITNIHEVDARINGDLITVSSRVAGWVTAKKVIEGDKITPGQVIFTIDSRESALKTQEMEAQLNSLRAERARTEAERRLTDKETETRLASEQARLAAAQVTVSSLGPQLDLARREHQRAQSLFEKRVSSRRQLDQAENELKKIEREHNIAIADLHASQAKVAEVDAEREKLRVLDHALAVFSHKEAEMQAKLDEQRLDLHDRTIKSPIDGVVDKTFVEAGEYVTPGQRLALIHDPQHVWIDANIKETDIRKVKLGGKVQVSVDAYPDRDFTGKVQVIGNSTTAEFALLPSPNPSGNFTKITQRLPVRIAIDQVDRLLRPGMMVEIKIDTDQ